MAVDHVPRHDDVAQRLRHLLAVGVGDVAEAEDVLVGAAGRTAASRSRAASRTSRASGRSPRRCSPPGTAPRTSSCVLERRVPLGERHRARVEPDVDHLGHAAQRLAAGRRAGSRRRRRRGGAGRRAARRRARSSSSNEPMQIVSPGLVAPDRQRRAPVALARERPVDVVLQPVAEAPVLDVLGVPVDGLVGGQQPVAQRGRADVPGRLGVVEQRRAAAPAVRVGVQQALGAQQPAARARGPRSGRCRRP